MGWKHIGGMDEEVVLCVGGCADQLFLFGFMPPLLDGAAMVLVVGSAARAPVLVVQVFQLVPGGMCVCVDVCVCGCVCVWMCVCSSYL